MTLTCIIATAFGVVWLLSESMSLDAIAAALLRIKNPDIDKSDLPDLNFRGRQYIGRKVIVDQALANGHGKVRVDDTLWIAQGPDLPTGATVKVTGTNGTVLVVEAV